MKLPPISGSIDVTLEEIGFYSFDAEIYYRAWPGEKEVRYDKDGAGYPGSPPTAELQSVRVTVWDAHDDCRRRGDGWVWDVLDTVALRMVEQRWSDTYLEECLDDAADHWADHR